MHLSLLSYLTFLITFQLLFLGVFLITNRKGNRRNNALLGTLFLLISWNMGDITLKMNNQVLYWDVLQKLDDGFFLLYGPLIYLYTTGEADSFSQGLQCTLGPLSTVQRIGIGERHREGLGALPHKILRQPIAFSIGPSLKMKYSAIMRPKKTE